MDRRTELNVWALEPYFGGSHKYFLEGLARHSAHHFALVTLPGRHWKWRMHGGALSLARKVRDEVVQPATRGRRRRDHRRRGRLHGGGRVPARMCCSRRTCSTCPLSWRWRTHGWLGAPAIVYFHENQLTYPLPPGVERDLGYGFKNLTTAAGGPTRSSSTASSTDGSSWRPAAELLAGDARRGPALGWWKRSRQRRASSRWGAICAVSTRHRATALARGRRRALGRPGSRTAASSGTSAGSTTRPRATCSALCTR